MIYLLTLVFYANSIPFFPPYFAFILLNCPPRLFFCLTEQCTVAFRSKFILPSGWVCVCLETELCLWESCHLETLASAQVLSIQTGDEDGQWEPDFFSFILSQALFILFYFDILKKLLSLESEFSTAFVWMWVTFPSLLVRTLWPQVLRYTSFWKLFSLLNF